MSKFLDNIAKKVSEKIGFKKKIDYTYAASIWPRQMLEDLEKLRPKEDQELSKEKCAEIAQKLRANKDYSGFEPINEHVVESEFRWLGKAPDHSLWNEDMKEDVAAWFCKARTLPATKEYLNFHYKKHLDDEEVYKMLQWLKRNDYLWWGYWSGWSHRRQKRDNSTQLL